MSTTSPTLNGFRAAFRWPSLTLAEISWRWSFGAACAALFVFSVIEYLDSLPVSQLDLLLLRSKQPALISRAIQHTLSGSALRVIEAVVILCVSLALIWIVMSSLGRAATARRLITYFRQSGSLADETFAECDVPRIAPHLALGFLRVAVTLAAVLSTVSAFLLAGFTSAHSAPAAVVPIAMSSLFFVWLAWSVLNWLLSFASVFVVAKSQNTFPAIRSAADLCLTRRGSLFAVGLAFGVAHIAVFVAATTAVAFPLGLGTILPLRFVLAGIIFISLSYFAACDFLYIGRLAAYVAIMNLHDEPAPAA